MQKGGDYMSDVTAIVTCMTDAEKPFITETLQSVHDQTIPCDAIVVVEDSNPWIEELCAPFPRVRILRRPFGYLGSVRNSGVAACDSEFVAFLDGDDLWLPSKTQKQLNFLRDGDRDFVGVDHMLMTESGEVFAFAFPRNIPMPSSWMTRRDIMLCYPFDPNRPNFEDGAWWVATLEKVQKWRIAEPLIHYRVRGSSLSGASLSKRRKLAVSKLSSLPLARPLLLATTGLLHSVTERETYLPLSQWRRRAQDHR
jgi:glycosyltransferase involved in cell wall biosynthesis